MKKTIKANLVGIFFGSLILLLAGSSYCTQAKSGNILVLLSSSGHITLKNGEKHPTGYFLSELMVPLESLIKLGYEITFATPKGKNAFMDKASDNVQYFKDQGEYTKLKKLHSSLTGIKKPKNLSKLKERDLDKFDAIFVPGGHAPMEDLSSSPEVFRVLNFFHGANKPTVLICHGPAALLSAKNSSGKWIYEGYKMISFTTNEEKIAEVETLKGQVKFYLDESLKSLGAQIPETKPWEAISVWDRELITGQNPMSDRELTRNFLMALVKENFAKAVGVTQYDPKAETLSTNKITHVIPFPQGWHEEFTNIYIGERKPGINSSDFLKKLARHVQSAKDTFEPAGLNGYLVLSNGNYEMALMNWKSREASEESTKAKGYDALIKDAGQILNPALFGEIPISNKVDFPGLLDK
jgi:putative intracellular protease/amidase